MKPKIAFQGERGAFSEQAVHQLCRGPLELLPCESFERTFHCVVSGRADACVIPVENTLAGSIHKNLDLLLEHSLTIAGETRVRIEHGLIALRGARMRDLRRVLSHPVALEQCRKFLRQHPRLQSEPAYDTAGSVKLLVGQGLRDTAAIASPLAAKVYGAEVMKRNIEDHRENYTRFWLLRQQPSGRWSKKRPSGQKRPGDKTSIVFSTRNIPGALFKCLSVFALRDIDLTKIESRPLVGRPFEYFFYVDFLGNAEEKAGRNALHHLEEVTDFLRILGCYPRG